MLLKRWIPAALLVVTLFSTVLIWQALVSSERAALSNHMESTASSAREFLKDELEARAGSLANIGKRWESKDGPVEAEWIADASALLENRPEFAAIVWAGSGREVRSSIPAKGALPVDFASEPWSPSSSPPQARRGLL
jgi:sensor domain CHASE-containing protein